VAIHIPGEDNGKVYGLHKDFGETKKKNGNGWLMGCSVEILCMQDIFINNSQRSPMDMGKQTLK
jgi:hypothetical protein